MLPLLSYLHTCFIRSYRFGPPCFLFLAGIVFVYSVVPNPVMESYSFSVSFLFVIAVMLSYAIMDIETVNQEAITMMHSGSIVRLYIAKLVYSWCFTIPFALFAVLYPVIFQSFNRPAQPSELLMSLLYHVSASWLAVTITGWFCTKFFSSRLSSFLLLTLVVVIAFSAESIEKLLPSVLQYAIMIVPPIYSYIDVLYHYEQEQLLMKWMPIGASLIYSFLSVALFLAAMAKRKQDSIS